MKRIDLYFTPVEKWGDNDLNMSGAPQEKLRNEKKMWIVIKMWKVC